MNRIYTSHYEDDDVDEDASDYVRTVLSHPCVSCSYFCSGTLRGATTPNQAWDVPVSLRIHGVVAASVSRS